MATAVESRAGALRACVQEHVDVTLNEVGEQAFDVILRDVTPQFRNTFVKLYNQTIEQMENALATYRSKIAEANSTLR